MTQTVNVREELADKICYYIMSISEADISDVKNQLYILMRDYEVSSRCTEVALLKEDRNEYLIRRFLIGKTIKGLSKRTLHYYEQTIRFFLNYVGKTIDEITTEDIRYYLAIRQGRDKITKVTADNERRNLNSFFTYLIAEELITKNPMARIDNIKCDRRTKEAFSEIEVEQLRGSANGVREKAMIEVLLSTGCRVTELVNIMLNEMEEDKIIVHGKGGKDRYVYLNARAQYALKNYIAEREDSNPYLFPGGLAIKEWEFKAGKKRGQYCDWWKNNELVHPTKPLDKGVVENTMRKIAKRAGVEKANPHKFRRTCATWALRRGMPIEQVSKMLGHSEISTTQIYLDLNEDDLKQAHRKYVV